MIERRLALVLSLVASGCIRGTLPPRELYRLAPPDSAGLTPPSPGAPALSGAIRVASYHAPGIYASGGIVYRAGATRYGVYPSREWAIPLGDMLGALSEVALRRHALTSGRVVFDPSASRTEPYVWRGVVREFDEVDGQGSVSTAVSLDAQLVRAGDDSVVWSGSAHEAEPVRDMRNMDAVIAALSTAAARAIFRLADEAATTLRRLAAAGAQSR